MRFLIFSVLLSLSLNMKGNDTTSFNLRQNIYFNISTDIFMAPFYGKTKYINNSIVINYDEKQQISGQKLKFGFGFKLFNEKLFIKHSISVKYGHLYFETNNLDSSGIGLISYNNSVRKFTFDQSLEISYPFHFRNISISPTIGYSWINLHSEYFYLTPNGFTYNGDFSINGGYFGASLSKNSFEIGLNLYIIDNNGTGYREVRNIFIPSLTIGYNINKNL